MFQSALHARDALPQDALLDPVKKMFLADRYVKGICPSCNAKDQYGDSCEVCGAVYQPAELIEPKSALTGVTPELRQSEHFFFNLSQKQSTDFLIGWVSSGTLQPEVANKLAEWFEKGLADWDISRDEPYFGIEIPDAPGKYFYVWLDAPIGYLASLKNHFDKGQARDHWHRPSRSDQSFDEFMSDESVEQVHFIGKDIIYFHALFWPAMLHFSGRKVPSSVYVHGHLNVNGEKMSKSRGNGIDPLRYLELGMNPDWLRYYLSAKLNSHVEDVDFNSKDFSLRVNSDLVGKYINIGSRSSGFLTRRFEGVLGEPNEDGRALLTALQELILHSSELLDQREFARTIREIMQHADKINEYFDMHAPWELSKDEGRLKDLHEVCTTSIEAFRLLTICLKPIIAALVRKVEDFLGVKPLCYSDRLSLLGAGHKINTYQHLITRVDPMAIDAAFDNHISNGGQQN
ncbi:methionine--tRNA ligase [Acidovorax sp. NPDC077693]|uniref:methionine--tRNA ligase n=1 Tax=unclassified Acidovorax TaxID=2684926 RepID=UPI0037C9B0CD